jgi:3-dehydroquinate dehydratase
MNKILIIVSPSKTFDNRNEEGIPQSESIDEQGEEEIRRTYAKFDIDVEVFHPEFEQDIVHRLTRAEPEIIGVVLNPCALQTFEDEIVSQLNDLKVAVIGIYPEVRSKDGNREAKFRMLNPPPVILHGFRNDVYYMALVAILELNHHTRIRRC